MNSKVKFYMNKLYLMEVNHFFYCYGISIEREKNIQVAIKSIAV
jgi:hypothetical protein